MRLFANHRGRSKSDQRTGATPRQVLIELKPGLEGDRLIEEMLRAVHEALADGCTRLLIDCRGIAGASSAFTSCILVIARRMYENRTECELIGLHDDARFNLELHRVERALDLAGVRIRPPDPSSDRWID